MSESKRKRSWKTVKTAYKAGTSNPEKLNTIHQFTKLKFNHNNALAGA
jgi:hypothetical protein